MSARSVLLVATVFAIGLPAFAIPIAPGQYYTEAAGLGLGGVLPTYVRNDDFVFPGIPLGFSFEFFGAMFTEMCVANNGNVQFVGNPCAGNFTPTATLDNQTLNRMIAPYWGDADTRADTISNVYFNDSVANQVIVTWDQVGYWNVHYNLRASFQLVIRGPGYVVPADEGRVGFFYKAVEWETGDASGGSGGFGGVEASVGFGDGLAAVNTGEVSIPGSREAGISTAVENRHFWFQLGAGGTPGPIIPEPSSILLAAGALGALLVARKRLV